MPTSANLADPTSWSLDGRSRAVESSTWSRARRDRRPSPPQGGTDRASRFRREARRPTLEGASGSRPGGRPTDFDGKVSIDGGRSPRSWRSCRVCPPAAGFGAVRRSGRGAGDAPALRDRHRRADARILQAKVGPAPLGNLVFRWLTDRNRSRSPAWRSSPSAAKPSARPGFPPGRASRSKLPRL